VPRSAGATVASGALLWPAKGVGIEDVDDKIGLPRNRVPEKGVKVGVLSRRVNLQRNEVPGGGFVGFSGEHSDALMGMPPQV